MIWFNVCMLLFPSSHIQHVKYLLRSTTLPGVEPCLNHRRFALAHSNYVEHQTTKQDNILKHVCFDDWSRLTQDLGIFHSSTLQFSQRVELLKSCKIYESQSLACRFDDLDMFLTTAPYFFLLTRYNDSDISWKHNPNIHFFSGI